MDLRGAVAVPGTMLDEVALGSHLGCLHDTDEALLDAAVPFAAGGIRHGERVICVVDASTADALLARLDAAGIDTRAAIAGSLLLLASGDDRAVREPVAEPRSPASAVHEEIVAALAAGAGGLRLVTQVVKTLRDASGEADRLLAFEGALNHEGAAGPCTSLCLYDRRRFPPDLLLEVLRTHPLMVVGTTVCANPHFVPPIAITDRGHAADQLEAWLRALLERQRMEDDLRDARLRLQRILEATGAGTWETNLQANVGIINERWAEILGYTLDELGPDSAELFRTLTHPDDIARADDLLARHLADETPDYRCELRMRHRDGHWVWIESRARLLQRSDDGRPLLMYGTHTDITERREAEEEIRLAHARFRRLFDADAVGIVIAAPDGRIIEANDHYLETLGYTRQEAEQGMVDWRAVTPPEWLPRDELALREIEERGACTAFEKEYVRRDGSRVPVVIAGAALPDSGIVTIVLDVGDRKAAQAALLESEVRYRRLFDSAADAVFVIDREDLRVIDANGMASRLYGYSHEELLALVSPDLSAEPEATAQFIRGAEAAPDGAPVTAQRRHRRKDGSVFPVEFTARTIEHDGRSMLLIAIRDITDRRAAEGAVREANAELEEAQRLAHVGSFTRDRDSGALTWSSELYRIFGVDQGEAPPTPAMVDRLYGPEGTARLRSAIERALVTGAGYRIDTQMTRPDGGVRQLIEQAEVLRGPDGEVRGLRGTVADVTELREAQALVDQAQRAEMVGRLAGGIAHDFNNLLTAIGGYAELLVASMAPHDPRTIDLAAITDATARAAGLTRQLLLFGRRQPLQPTLVHPGAVLAGLNPIVRSLVPADIAVEIRRGPDAGMVLADRDLLEHALVNLVLNARDAMPAGGRLTIETGTERIAAGDPRLRPPALPGDYVWLTVSDTGSGIAPDVLPHIFEPFFTTKPMWQGSGLGLSSVDGFVDQSGGFLTVDTTVGSGSSFSIHLRRANPDDGSAPGRNPSGATILVVDDEPGVRAVTARMLRELGHAVVEAGDAETALSALGGSAGIDLVVTDVVLPGMNGRELARACIEADPGLPVLLISGYAADALPVPPDGGPELPFLAKPFSMDALGAHVRRLLGRES